jgi:hypothetical protein
MTTVLNTYSCLSVYLACFGLSFTAYEEFFDIVYLQSPEVTASSQLILTHCQTLKRKNLRHRARHHRLVR